MNLLIDGLNIAYRSHHVYDVKQGLTNSDGIPTGMVYGFLKTFIKWRKSYPDHRIIVTWDCPKAKAERQKICPHYKANRDSTKSDQIPNPIAPSEIVDVFTLQLIFIREILDSLGISQVEAETFEADDILATLVRSTLVDATNIILSSDKDLLQLVTSKVVVATPEGTFYDRDSVFSKFGVPPEFLLTYRCLDGDKSDGLLGIPRVRRKVLAGLVYHNEGNLDSIFDGDLELCSVKEKEKILAFKESAFLNRKVMELKEVPNIDISVRDIDPERLEHLLNILDIHSLKEPLLNREIPSGFIKLA
jgi:DNA polymerase-1